MKLPVTVWLDAALISVGFTPQAEKKYICKKDSDCTKHLNKPGSYGRNIMVIISIIRVRDGADTVLSIKYMLCLLTCFFFVFRDPDRELYSLQQHN